jgi:type I restriction-modification system DNA methylase subunit
VDIAETLLNFSSYSRRALFFATFSTRRTHVFLEACDRITKNYKLDKAQKQFLKNQTFKGFDVADGVVRLCAMNLYLHGIAGDESPVEAKDSLQRFSNE